jgi:hypothetical protein
MEFPVKHCVIFLITLILALLPSASVAIPAFPGAEGYGSETPGGRGGRVIKVTNLNMAGPGSFAEACKATGPRIVVFEVSGTINFFPAMAIQIYNPNLTIAGQTAPGGGITIANAGFYVFADDVIIRFIRVRGAEQSPLINQGGDALQMPDVNNNIVDHCSFAWACDETVDLSGSRNVTIQWSIINESSIYDVGTTNFCHEKLIPHNFAVIHKYDSAGLFSMHHNLLAHHERRYPLLNAHQDDFRNNVMYHFGSRCIHTDDAPDQHQIPYPHDINVVNNYFKRGSGAPVQSNSSFRFYVNGNIREGSTVIESGNHEKLSAPYSGSPQITTHTARESYDMVLERAGAWPRDSLDRRTVRDVINNTGEWGRHDEPLSDSAVTPPVDTDNDGMPDDWERAHSLDPNDSSDCGGTDLRIAGYTNIEVYINELADNLIQSGQAGNILQGNSDHVLPDVVRVFPNPFSTSVFFELRTAKSELRNMSLGIYDITGKLIYKLDQRGSHSAFRSSGYAWNALNYPSGIYFVRIKTGEHILKQKLIKM